MDRLKIKDKKMHRQSPIMMGPHEMEECPEEKCLGDQIHRDRLAARLLITINKQIDK